MMKIFIFSCAFSILSASAGNCEGAVCLDENVGVQSNIQLMHLKGQQDHSVSEFVSKAATELKRFAQSTRFYSLSGSSHKEITAKLNKFAALHASVRDIVPCSSLDVKGVSLLAEKLRPFINFDTWRSFGQDDGRQISINPWAPTSDASWHRDALCAETMKLWAHHIDKVVKDSPKTELLLPSLPTHDFEAMGLDITELAIEARQYNKSLSCVAGHSSADYTLGDDLNAVDWPHWPSVTHFRAKGHGVYPFWQFGPPESEWKLNMSWTTPYLYNPGNEMEVWHSTPLQSTKFYHSSCRWEWLGFPQLDMHPCVGLMIGKFSHSGKWYMYTADSETKATDENFCCESTWIQNDGMQLGTINRKFVDDMIYIGEADFTGDYYTGRSKRYIMAMDFAGAACPECEAEPILPINVFYETDLRGRPLRFGEWGQDLVFDGYLRDTDLPMMYEEMDPTSWDDPSMLTFSNDVFDVPKVCRTDLHGCRPGRVNREIADAINFGSGKA